MGVSLDRGRREDSPLGRSGDGEKTIPPHVFGDVNEAVSEDFAKPIHPHRGFLSLRRGLDDPS